MSQPALTPTEFSSAVTAITSAFGDPTRREIYLFSREHPDGVTAAEVARRFALHCMYIYAADGVRPNATSQRKRRLKKYVERAEEVGDEPMAMWAHNCRVLMTRPELYDYEDWIEGGLVRHPRRLAAFGRR